jgi:hypothetical protein
MYRRLEQKKKQKKIATGSVKYNGGGFEKQKEGKT